MPFSKLLFCGGAFSKLVGGRFGELIGGSLFMMGGGGGRFQIILGSFCLTVWGSFLNYLGVVFRLSLEELET